MQELMLTAAHWGLMLESKAPAAATLVVVAPYDGAQIATVDTAGPKQAEDALAAAYALYRNRAGWLRLHQRVAILERLAVLMTEHQDVLALEAAREGGKPLVDSRVEITRAIDGVRLCIEHIRGHAGDVIPMGTTAAAAGRVAFTQKEPIGVVVAVSAFNHPLNLIVHQVLAGDRGGLPGDCQAGEHHAAVLFAPRRAAARSRLAEWLVPGRGVRAGRRRTTRHRPSRAFFSFIGSGEVGWSLRSKLAPGTRCALEHGGVAPVDHRSECGSKNCR